MRRTVAQTCPSALPNATKMVFEVGSVVEEGNVVVLEGATKGTFTGPMMTADGEVLPTGKSYEAPLVAVCELSGTGLIAA